MTVDGSGQEHREERRHTLWTTLQAFVLRREQAYRAFGLLAAGKPAPKPAAQDEDDPFAQFETPREAAAVKVRS